MTTLEPRPSKVCSMIAELTTIFIPIAFCMIPNRKIRLMIAHRYLYLLCVDSWLKRWHRQKLVELLGGCGRSGASLVCFHFICTMQNDKCLEKSTLRTHKRQIGSAASSEPVLQSVVDIQQAGLPWDLGGSAWRATMPTWIEKHCDKTSTSSADQISMLMKPYQEAWGTSKLASA